MLLLLAVMVVVAIRIATVFSMMIACGSWVLCIRLIILITPIILAVIKDRYEVVTMQIIMMSALVIMIIISVSLFIIIITVVIMVINKLSIRL